MAVLVDTVEAARQLGLKPGTLNQWRWLGKGPRFRKLGGAVRYHVDDLQNWVEQRVRTSTSDTCSTRATQVSRAPGARGRR